MNDRDFTERERTVIGLVTVHFEGRSLDPRLVDVNKLEGGERPTLRLTLDDRYSTDLERTRVADSSLALEDLAAEAIGDLVTPGLSKQPEDRAESRSQQSPGGAGP